MKKALLLFVLTGLIGFVAEAATQKNIEIHQTKSQPDHIVDAGLEVYDVDITSCFEQDFTERLTRLISSLEEDTSVPDVTVFCTITLTSESAIAFLESRRKLFADKSENLESMFRVANQQQGRAYVYVVTSVIHPENLDLDRPTDEMARHLTSVARKGIQGKTTEAYAIAPNFQKKD